MPQPRMCTRFDCELGELGFLLLGKGRWIAEEGINHNDTF